MDTKQVNNFLGNSGYTRSFKAGMSEIKIHKVGWEYQVEIFINGQFSHILEAGLNELDALQIAIEESAKYPEPEAATCECAKPIKALPKAKYCARCGGLI